jgi:hypothetical protein
MACGRGGEGAIPSNDILNLVQNDYKKDYMVL